MILWEVDEGLLAQKWRMVIVDGWGCYGSLQHPKARPLGIPWSTVPAVLISFHYMILDGGCRSADAAADIRKPQYLHLL
jgi:hypothetical protein